MNAPVNPSIAQAQRAIASGRALFRKRLVPECEAYMALALRSLLEAWVPIGSSESAAPGRLEEQALAELAQAKYPGLDRLRAAQRSTAGQVPATKLAGSRAREREFDWIWTEVDRLSRFTDWHFNPAQARKRLGIRLTLVVLPFAIVAAMFFALQRSRPQTFASASYAAGFPASHVVDGLEATEWLLPDATSGWLDLNFKAPRTIDSIRLINAHNGTFADRGSKRVRLTAFANQDRVASVEGAFSPAGDERTTLDLPLEAKGVTRLRVDVLSYFDMGGGLAEVEVH